MSTETIIDNIERTVLDPSFDRPRILDLVNEATLAIATRVLLPELADGFDTITTVDTDFVVAIPDTFHRHIISAKVGSYPITVYPSFSVMQKRLGNISVDSGDVTGIAEHGRMIAYQKTSVADIDLWFYRLPVDTTDASDAYPDGIRNNPDFDRSIHHYVCWQAFEEFEDGIEGRTPNSDKHLAKYELRLKNLSDYCKKISGREDMLPDSSPPLLFG